MLLKALVLLAALVSSSDGVPIHYTAQGKGEPALVFIHCWTCDRHIWDAQMSGFARNHRVVAIDLPGHGESRNGRKDWTMEAFGEDADYKEETTKYANQYLFAASTPAAIRQRVLAGATSAPKESAIAMLRSAMQYDPVPALREIKAPIRAINGDLFPTNVEGNRKHAPQFEAVIMKGTGHYPMLEDPPRFNELLVGVLRDLS